MADCKYTPREFIQRAFAPLVAVFTSAAVDEVCKKNNLSFVQLLKPFCTIDKEVRFRDPSGTIVTINHIHISISDINSNPPESVIARKLLNESVSQETCENTVNVHTNSIDLQIPATVPWFDSWRETFLQVQFPSDHEFTKHYIACIIVTSSTDNDPLDTLSNMVQKLQQMLGVSPAKIMPKWFSSSILRYYVLLHDLSVENISKANGVYDEMKLTYSPQCCHMLQINSNTLPNDNKLVVLDYWSQYVSRSQNTHEDVTNNVDNYTTDKEDPFLKLDVMDDMVNSPNSFDAVTHPLSSHVENKNALSNNQETMENYCGNKNELRKRAQYLTENDVNSIKMLMISFVMDALVPFVETQLQYLNEMVSNKKGVSKSLFSATKRWFGTSKPGSPANIANTYVYNNDSLEIQMRRLADLCFMFGAYTYSFQAYHTAKRDFNAHAAWLYYAGALEMAALSAFLVGLDIRKAQEYAEESITTYLHTCRMPQFATRVTLCVSELLKELGLYGEAARHLIQMTSEDSDLRSALLLEQASYCFIKAKKPCMPRKYAFHLVLAGHRFSKAGQKKHSLRSYRQAYQVYKDKNWSLAEDHIHFTIGRLAVSLKETDVPVKEFAKLFTHPSRQLPVQQAAFLKEYIVALTELQSENRKINREETLPRLEVPQINHSSIKVMLDSMDDNDIPGGFIPASGLMLGHEESSYSRWWKLEENLVTCANNSLPFSFKPTISLLSDFTNNSTKPFTVIGESINMSIDLVNVLNIPVSLQNIRLMWHYTSVSASYSDITGKDPLARTHCIPLLVLDSDSTMQVLLNIVPKAVGELHVTGISYSVVLPRSVEAAEAENGISITGYQKLQPRAMKITTKENLRNQNPNNAFLPDYRLQFNVIDLAPCLRVNFENLPSEMLCGELHKVTIHFRNVGMLPISRIFLTTSVPNLISVPLSRCDKNSVCKLPLTEAIQPDHTNQVTIYMRAPDINGHFSVDLLFYYDSNQAQSSHNQKLKYRLVYHSLHLFVRDSIYASASTNRSMNCNNEENYNEIINIKLHIRNKNPITNTSLSVISLHQISMYSKNWDLFDIVRPLDEEIINLQSMETVFLLLKARRKLQHTDNHFSDLYLSENLQISSNEVPYSDFITAKAVSSTDCNKHQNYSNPVLEGMESENNCSSIQSAIEINSLLAIRWKSEVKRNKTSYPVMGQHHIMLANLGEKYTSSVISAHVPNASTPVLKIFEPQFNIPDSTTDKIPHSPLNINKQLVLIQLKHKQFVVHSFSEQRMCCVPVHLILQNCSSFKLEVRVDTLQKSNSNTSANKTASIQGTESSSNFWWLGVIQRIIKLSEHSTTIVNLTGCFGMAGAYDLTSSLTISARIVYMNEQCFFVQASKPVSYIFISDKT